MVVIGNLYNFARPFEKGGFTLKNQGINPIRKF